MRLTIFPPIPSLSNTPPLAASSRPRSALASISINLIRGLLASLGGHDAAYSYFYSCVSCYEKTTEKLAPTDKLNSRQSQVVADIVRNAGIYNGSVASGLFYAAFMGDSARDVALVVVIGVSAGIFGTITLRSSLCALQGVLGLVGWYFLR
jgi:uncharacterized membrane protein